MEDRGKAGWLMVSAMSVAAVLGGGQTPVGAADESLSALKDLAGFAEWAGRSGPVRAGLRLRDLTITALGEAGVTQPNSPWVVWEIEEGAVARDRTRWEIDPENFVEVTLSVGETRADAHEYLIERHYNRSMSFSLRVPRRDEPPVAGDLSVELGREFIRDNIVVEMRTEGVFISKVHEIAKEIDGHILSTQTAMSAEQVMPEIVLLTVERDSLEQGDMGKLLVNVRDPLGGNMEYHWSAIGGGVEERGGVDYFRATEIGVAVIALTVIGDSGFRSTQETQVEVVEQGFF